MGPQSFCLRFTLTHLSCPLVPLPAFEKGHCYEPYLQNGNFTTSDPTYNIGTVVEFSCDPGHSLEQGPAIIECINVRDPYWNDTEPLCRGEWGPETKAPAQRHGRVFANCRIEILSGAHWPLELGCC